MADATADLTRTAEEARDRALLDDVNDQLKRANEVYQLWWCWADFELFIITPSVEPITPPLLILPEVLPDSGSKEFVYPIYDYGYKLITSKSEDMYTAGKSMCKLYYTIEKMIYLLIERLKTGGVSPETEVQIALNGFEKALRKAFESVINLKYNVVITNFDPGAWGENYLEIVKRLADKGYGYPPEAPRDSFRQTHTPQISPR